MDHYYSKYRGAAITQWSVLNEIKQITTMFMDAEWIQVMILKEEVEIGENETTGELWTKLSTIMHNQGKNYK